LSKRKKRKKDKNWDVSVVREKKKRVKDGTTWTPEVGEGNFWD